MWNKIPFAGWLISALAAISLAVPFWFFWSILGVGKTYFFFLPLVYQTIPFWDAVGLFIVMVMVVVLAHCPTLGVKVYVVVVVLFNAGDQVPVTPLVDVVGKELKVLPLQIGET